VRPSWHTPGGCRRRDTATVGEALTASAARVLLEQWEAAYSDDAIIVYNPTATLVRDGDQSAGQGRSPGRTTSTLHRRM